MSKIKIEIKNRFTGKLLFEYESDNNSIKQTLVEGLKQGADLRGAYLRGAYLQGADLQGADLRGAYLRGCKIKTAAVFTGLYEYVVIPYITEQDENRIKMGCFDRSLNEWDDNFWNNDSEFPNDGSFKSEQRLMAFKTAKRWLTLAEKEINKVVVEK